MNLDLVMMKVIFLYIMTIQIYWFLCFFVDLLLEGFLMTIYNLGDGLVTILGEVGDWWMGVVGRNLR
jgi:hypothetical protein